MNSNEIGQHSQAIQLQIHQQQQHQVASQNMDEISQNGSDSGSGKQSEFKGNLKKFVFKFSYHFVSIQMKWTKTKINLFCLKKVFNLYYIIEIPILGRRSNVVKQVEKLKKNREERRAKQQEIMVEKVAQKNVDPGNN